MTLFRGVVGWIVTILSQCQNVTYKLKMFRSNVPTVFMQSIVISLLSFHWRQLVVQSIICDAGVFFSGRKLLVCIRIPVATIYDAQRREPGVSRKKWRRRRRQENTFLIRLTRVDSPQLFDFFLNVAVTRAERFEHPKKTHENVNFDLFLYSVQPQLPSSGESSYSINMSGGNTSIGDHSVTNVGTATPRWRIPKCYFLYNDHWAMLVDYKELFFNSIIAKRPYTIKAPVRDQLGMFCGSIEGAINRTEQRLCTRVTAYILERLWSEFRISFKSHQQLKMVFFTL